MNPSPPTDPKTTKRDRRLPLLLKRRAAARYCGFSLATWDRMSAAATNPAGLRIGGSRMFRRDELAAWVAADCPTRDQWLHIWASIRNPQTKA